MLQQYMHIQLITEAEHVETEPATNRTATGSLVGVEAAILKPKKPASCHRAQVGSLGRPIGSWVGRRKTEVNPQETAERKGNRGR